MERRSSPLDTDEKIRSGIAGSIKIGSHNLLGNLLRILFSGRTVRSQFLHGAGNFVPAAVVYGNDKGQAGIVLCLSFQTVNAVNDILVKAGTVSDHFHADIVCGSHLQQADHIEAEQLHQSAHLFRGTLPVLCRKTVYG